MYALRLSEDRISLRLEGNESHNVFIYFNTIKKETVKPVCNRGRKVPAMFNCFITSCSDSICIHLSLSDA